MAYDAGRGRIVLFGGYVAPAFVNDTWEYDGTAWTLGAGAPAGLVGRTNASLVHDGLRARTVLFGGRNGGPLSDVWEYDGASWAPGAPVPAGLVARWGHAMAFDAARGRSVLHGGSTGSARLNDTWEYDGAGWIAGPAAPAGMTARYSHGMAFDAARSRIVVFGGGYPLLNDTWEYDGIAWSAGPAAPAALTKRMGLSLVFDPGRGSMVLFGGNDNTYKNDTWFYDGAAWSPGPSAPSDLLPRGWHAAAFDTARGRAVLHGGRYGTELDDTWELDATGWTPGVHPPVVLIPRSGHGMVYDSARDRVVLFGGVASNPYGYGWRGDVWEFDGAGWTAAAYPPAGVGRRASHGMAFDSVRNRTVLVGGGGVYTGSPTWEYDGTTWTPGAAAPPGVAQRVKQAMTFDASRGRTVMFGGANGNTSLNDTWEYDGASWVGGPAAPPGLTPRREAAMAFDVARSRIVLFGGLPDVGVPDDTWEYDGVAWSEGPPASVGLEPRYGHAMAYDAVRGRIVLFGGYDNWYTVFDDTWEYDGTAWTPGAEGPSRRANHAMVYDPTVGRVVLFGGSGAGGDHGDTWLYGPCPAISIQPSLLPAGTYGQAYSQSCSASGGTAPYSFGLLAGRLPAGLTLAGSGMLSGIPLEVGSFSFTVGAVDATGCAGTRSYSLPITCPVLTISPASLPPGTVGAAYSQALTATGGAPPYTFSVTAGQLPPGLLLGTGGVLAGTPTTAGTYAFEVTVRDDSGCTGSRSFLLSITCGSIDVLPPTLPDGVVGQAYVVVLAASGGTAPHSFTMAAGGLPPGVALASSGLLSGLPTAGGSYSFVVAATDATGCAGQRAYVLEVDRLDSIFAGAGLGPGNPNRVRAFTADGRATAVDFMAYVAGTWGVNVAGSDIDGGSFAEILTGPGPGEVLGPQVRGFRRDGGAIAKVSYFAYGTLRYGVNVAGGEVDGDAFAEPLTGPGPGAVFGPQVRGWDFDGLAVGAIAKLNYFAYGTLRYGANVSGGDVDVDAFDEILTAPGPGASFGPQVRGWDFDGVAPAAIAKINFAAFPVAAFGANVSSGDVESDGYDEIVVVPGPGPTLPSWFRGFDYDATAVQALAGFDVTPFGTYYGGRIGAGVIAEVDRAALLAGAGRDPSADSTVKGFHFDGIALAQLPGSFVPFMLYSYGVNVAGADLGL